MKDKNELKDKNYLWLCWFFFEVRIIAPINLQAPDNPQSTN